MKANINLFWVLFAFCLVADTAYIIWSLVDPIHGGQIEWVGTLAIGLSGAAITAYLASGSAG